MRLIIAVGTRPNFVKISPLIKQLRNIEYKLVHTGQHYDVCMSECFFRDLDLPDPDINLGIGSGTHAEQTGKIMIEFEKVCQKEKPDLVVVVGDVNSTLGCALAAAKLNIKVAHIEAGVRVFDNSIPEEVNRRLVDHISDVLFAPNYSAVDNLVREGISTKKIHLVGNIMVDSLKANLDKCSGTAYYKPYVLATIHRPENVDNEKNLVSILMALKAISKTIPVIFPVHPRTMKRITEFKLNNYITNSYVTDFSIRYPQSYLTFLSWLKGAQAVITDSGGIQVETSVLRIPCITISRHTPWDCTLRYGTNTLVSCNTDEILEAFSRLGKRTADKADKIPSIWDGRASKRIVEILLKGGSHGK